MVSTEPKRHLYAHQRYRLDAGTTQPAVCHFGDPDATGTDAAIAMSIIGLIFVGIMWISLSYAVPLSRRLGDTGSQVIARFFGFVLLAIGWSILTKGLVELMPGLAG